ncbi:response regulator transcription factor [Vibrio fortis]|uniref:response regulator transcription factor n=1 Tax=Vibrio fortis TaxID=212667 RepID=UPI0038CD6EF2
MESTANKMTAQILLVEDDNDLAELVTMHLRFQGQEVCRVASIGEAKSAYQENDFDLVVLDRGLPDGDGVEFCRSVRKEKDWTPMLMLTARDSEMDKVSGLEAGLDDYITKPFSVLEFQARVRNVLRRISHEDLPAQPTSQQEHTMSFGPLVIDTELHQVVLDGRELSLTAMEFSLLSFLATKPGRVYSKDQLLDHVWNTHHAGYHHTVCSTVNRLRSKLVTQDGEQNYIQTVWGVGYKFHAKH